MSLGTGTITVSPSVGRLPTLFSSGAGHILYNPINLASNTPPLIVNGAQTLTLGGVISGIGSLNQAGPGQLRLSPTGSNNSYSGGTSVSGGELAFDSNSTGTDPSVSLGPVGTGTQIG